MERIIAMIPITPPYLIKIKYLQMNKDMKLFI